MTETGRDAIRQALDAMARARSTIDLDRVALIDSHKNGDGILDDEAAWAVEDYDTAIRDIDEAGERLADVMHAALAEQEAEPVGGSCPTCEALARTVMCDQVSYDARPAAYAVHVITDDDGIEEWDDIFTSPDVAREAADAYASTGMGERYEVVPLYTAPPRRDWHGLTDEEVERKARASEREACIDIVARHGGSVEIEAAIRARGDGA